MFSEPSFISYAQNFEDVMLWRALRYFPAGTYVDVGANDPRDDSVTRAFYEKGWRGINIEPVKSYYDALCADRPEDINLQVVAGAVEGVVNFYELPDSGLSTADIDRAESLISEGANIVKKSVRSTTLAALWQEYVKSEVHFLKIDVEGFESEVLAGVDFSRWRPWILVIESPFQGRPVWEPDILAAGYQSVYFDGLNRFYLADEHMDLKGAFELPPCNLDNFRLCRGHRMVSVDTENIGPDEWRARAQLAEEELKTLRNSRTYKAIELARRVSSLWRPAR